MTPQKMTPEDALEITAGAFALILAQGVIVTNHFFNESEIRKYLQTRLRFQPLFSMAALEVAAYFAAEEDALLQTIVEGLEMFAESPRDFKRAMRGVDKVLKHLHGRSFMSFSPGARARFGRVFHILWAVANRDHTNWSALWEKLWGFKAIPAPLRTLFRKMSKMSFNALPTTADPGAWFDMAPEEKVRIRHQVQVLKEKENTIHLQPTTPTEKLAEYRAVAQQLADLQGEAGVNLTIIEKEDEVPVAHLLKKERSLVRDGVAEYVLQQFLKTLPSYGSLTPRERGKLTTVLQKAKTFQTMIRIIREAVDRKLLGKSALEGIEHSVTKAQENLAVASGIPLAPIPFRPMQVEEFQGAHDAGMVTFRGEWSEEDKATTLGRVSASITHLEGIFGQGFCGKHAKKLAFVFVEGLATNCYFAWGRRDRWQPEVTFESDFDGVLAHELSHFLGDLLSFRVGKKEGLIKDYEYGDIGHGPGDVFGNTGVSVEDWIESTERGLQRDKSMFNAPVLEVPEFLDLMKVVVGLPDYARWSDKLGSLDMYLPKAFKDILGKDFYDYNDPEMAQYREAQYRSEIPEEVLSEAMRLLAVDRGGDTRKLTYWNSSVEIWARLCEQYVYTKLAQAGISNPWLTRMSYGVSPEDDIFVGQDSFMEFVKPIMDRLFDRLRSKRILACRKQGSILRPPRLQRGALTT